MPELSFSDFIATLLARHSSLRGEVCQTIDNENDEDAIVQNIEARNTFTEEVMKCYNALCDKTDELQQKVDEIASHKRELKEIMRETKNDCEKMDRRKWYLIRARKLSGVQ